jgi:uncharacterized protein YrrD
VIRSDGQKVGRIERVVLDPGSKALTHLVVKKGFLFTKDKVIPFDEIETATDGRVVLKEGRRDPDDFADFEEPHYIPIEETRAPERRSSGILAPLAWYYPVPGGPWWRRRMGTYKGYPEPPYARLIELNIPEGTVALEEGAKVVASDDEYVGDIERVYVDEDEQRVTHLLISKGFISKSRRLIPSMWVESVREDAVRLSVAESFIENLPQYRPRA